MASDIRDFIKDIVIRSGLYEGVSEGYAVGMYSELAELLLSYVLRGMIPVIVNIMVMSIPRFLFIVSVFNEYKILTMSEQSEVMSMVMNSGAVDMNMDDDAFSKLLLKCVEEYKQNREKKGK